MPVQIYELDEVGTYYELNGTVAIGCPTAANGQGQCLHGASIRICVDLTK
jgi:hypothetical protein